MNNNLYVIQIPRSEVESKDIGTITHYISQLEKIKAPSQCVEITFSGFDDTTEEVFEIKDIRDWTTIALREAPEILYYTSLPIGTTTRLLSCVYDIETVSSKRMDAYEAVEYAAIHGDLPQQPVIITIPDDERSRLYGAIKSYGIKRKDSFGAGVIVKSLKELFGD
ncbi:hypothetical protein OB446_027275 [Paenibacillus alvei]|uniref:hypothetical protein n=1 Tax=Paenibacillus alvei TaxID=44250 RepID=UPI000288A6E5|nr:hypothetical protein [Paenibacillus alvei]EJW13981.1 hypothetical protein PAV_141p00870 [Paenibacillus alvei DSM 29]MCY9707657.1 hypothetical protein [Paenibacillus alvei]MEC0082831.1 hypothetical protein [Paenibacillus alvei]